jgi:Zn-dependent peptidase ImmA (M78 family)/transcriptional regulator with XRE-family HTH domain
MAQQIPGINPQLLVWARQRAGQSIDDVAAALHKPAELIESWEAGTASPTYVQLETLAYKVFKRPVALFFFPDPPEESDPEHEFRTLPTAEVVELDADTRLKVREAHALQIQLDELTGGRNPAEHLILRDLDLPATSPVKSAETVREYLGVSLTTQTDTWTGVDEALKAWRSAVERAGVFVFKDSFKQRDISGFSLQGSEFPLIVINNSTAPARQIFTLFHELAHLLVHESGVTKTDDGYIAHLSGHAHRVEVFCNAFAAELLVPSDGFRTAAKQGTSDAVVSALAARYKVSRAVILRRMLDLNLVTHQAYETRARQWDEEYEIAQKARKEKGGGGNYYHTLGTYLSDRYTQLAFSQYYRGQISADQLAGYLNVSVKNVPTFEEHMLRKVG